MFVASFFFSCEETNVSILLIFTTLNNVWFKINGVRSLERLKFSFLGPGIFLVVERRFNYPYSFQVLKSTGSGYELQLALMNVPVMSKSREGLLADVDDDDGDDEMSGGRNGRSSDVHGGVRR